MKKKIIPITLQDSNTYNLSYYDWGDENAPNTLICVHGLTRNAKDFDRLAEILSKYHNYRVICPDIFGRGESDFLKDASSYNFENYKIALLELIKNLNLDTINFLGTSMGGMIAMHLGQGISFNKLILNDIGTFIPKAFMMRLKNRPSDLIFSNYELATEYYKKILVTFGVKAQEDLDYLISISLKNTTDNNFTINYDQKILKNLSMLKDEEITDIDLSGLWVNVSFNKLLILRGKNSDLFSHENALSLVNMHSTKANLIEFEDVGHAPSLVEVYQLNELINWLIP